MTKLIGREKEIAEIALTALTNMQSDKIMCMHTEANP